MITETYIYQNNQWNRDPFNCSDSENNLVLIFGNDKEEAKKIIDHYKKSIIAGVSTVTNLAPDSHHLKDALVVSIMKFEKTTLRAHYTHFKDYDSSLSVAEEIVNELDQYENLKGVLTFSDAVMMSGTQFSEGLKFLNNKNVHLAGSIASGKDIHNTFMYSRNGAEQYGAMAIGFYGDDLFFSSTIGTGAKAFGIERIASKCDKNILYEIDNSPAFDLYKKYLSNDFAEIREQFDVIAYQFPIAVTKVLELKEEYVRTPVGLTEDGSGIILAGEIKEGSTIRLMRTTSDNFLDGAENAAHEVFEVGRPVDTSNFRSLIINCEARRATLGESLEDEAASINKILNIESIGTHYSFGELCHNQSGCGLMHTQTIVILVIGEL
ncbi:MAG: FIST C-terminal domain-containing protein [Pseudomonadota bacterium]